MAALSRYTSHALDEDGNALSGVKIEVRQDISGLPLADVYSDRDGATALSNPFNLTDVNGEDDGTFFFHAVGGVYKIRVYTGSSESPTFERIWRYVPIGTASEYDFASGFNPRGEYDSGTTYAKNDLVSFSTVTSDVFAFVSNSDSNTGNEPSITADPGNVPESDTYWTVLQGIESPGAVGAAGSSDVDATSDTSNTITEVSKSFTLNETARGWTVGARLRVSSRASPSANYMEGVVTSYDDASALTMLVDYIPVGVSAGPFTDWNINIAGEQGVAGVDGDGAGDVIGPEGGVASGEAVVFSSGTGKAVVGAGAAPVLEDVMTTQGDILVRGASVAERIAKAAEGQILAAGASIPEYREVKAVLSPLVTPGAASESSGDITLDVANGGTNSFTRTMAGNETLLAPVNMPVGWTIYFDVTPGANTLTFDTEFVAPTPDVGSTRTLIAIFQRATDEFIAITVHEAE